jgi:hypothetical protein
MSERDIQDGTGMHPTAEKDPAESTQSEAFADLGLGGEDGEGLQLFR